MPSTPPPPPPPPTLLPPSTTYFEVIGIPKSRLAGSASVGMFSAVLHAVTSQVAQLTERGPALVTLERPLSCVGAAVHSQVGRGGEGCPAHFALKRLFSCETANSASQHHYIGHKPNCALKLAFLLWNGTSQHHYKVNKQRFLFYRFLIYFFRDNNPKLHTESETASLLGTSQHHYKGHEQRFLLYRFLRKKIQDNNPKLHTETASLL